MKSSCKYLKLSYVNVISEHYLRNLLMSLQINKKFLSMREQTSSKTHYICCKEMAWIEF